MFFKNLNRKKIIILFFFLISLPLLRTPFANVMAVMVLRILSQILFYISFPTWPRSLLIAYLLSLLSCGSASCFVSPTT